MQENNYKKSFGFMTIEVLVSASIILMSVLAAMDVTQKSLILSREALHVTQASFLLEEGAEKVRINRDNSWASFSLPSNDTVGIFSRSFSVAQVCRDNSSKDIATCSGSADPDTGTKLVTVTVSWDEGSTNVAKTLSFYIMNLFE